MDIPNQKVAMQMTKRERAQSTCVALVVVSCDVL